MNLSAMTREQLEAMVLSLKTQSQRKLTLKVSAKGAVSMYGLGRFPITLYPEQWRKVMAERDNVEAFIDTNADVLSQGKDDPRFAKQTEQ